MQKNRFLGCAACATLALQIAGGAARGDATAYQNDPAHDGSVVMPGFHPIPTVMWKVNTGQTFSYPLIVGNQIIVNGANQLQAYNASTGNVNWSVAIGGAPEFASGSAPAYDNGMIFLNGPQGTYYEVMSAYNVLNGHQVWSTPMPGQTTFNSPVTASNGSAYTVGTGMSGTLYSVRESDGKLQWTATVSGGDNSAPTVTSDGVYVSYVGPQTYKFGVSDGSTIWRYSGAAAGGGGDTSVYYNNRLYISQVYSTAGTSNQLVALDTNTGAKAYDTLPASLFAPVSTPRFL